MADEAPDRAYASTMGGDVIPGSEVLLDVHHDLHLKQGESSDLVLIPQPSNNLDDPLNWSSTWKYTVVLVQFAYTFVSVTAALSVAPMFPLFEAEFQVDQTRLNLLSGVCILGQAYANFLIVPYSNIFGRRQACLTCAVLMIVTEVWQAEATSYQSLLAGRAVNGLVSAISESVMVQIINDIFFSHQRGTWMGVYFATYFFGVFMGTIIAGSIAGKHGWRSFFWLSTGLSGFNLITLLFGFPETKYKRTTAGLASPSPNTTRVQSEKEIGKDNASLASQEASAASPISPASSVVGQGRPSKRQWALWQKPDARWKSYLVRDLFSPFRIAVFPIILWAAFVVGGSINVNLFYAFTESEVLAAPPYNFNTASVGYSNFASLTGGILGLLTAGPLSDYIVRRAARKNNGVREAEMRLPALIPYTILMTIGITVGGLAYQHQWSWPVLLCVGFAGAGLTVTSIPTIVIAYAIDCYRPLAGEIMVVATVVKNTCGFGMSYWLPILGGKYGLLTPAMVQYSLAIGPLCLGVLIYFFGKNLRVMTKDSYVHQLSQY